MTNAGKWRDREVIIWTCTRVEGAVVVLERMQAMICRDGVTEVGVKIVETLKRLSSQYKRVERWNAAFST